jgi:non-homologous end joining protein Ku
VIGAFDRELDLSTYRVSIGKDCRRSSTRRLIKGEQVVTPEVQAPAHVVNLMGALKRSLNAVSAGKKEPAKAGLSKRQPARLEGGRRKTG